MVYATITNKFPSWWRDLLQHIWYTRQQSYFQLLVNIYFSGDEVRTSQLKIIWFHSVVRNQLWYCSIPNICVLSVTFISCFFLSPENCCICVWFFTSVQNRTSDQQTGDNSWCIEANNWRSWVCYWHRKIMSISEGINTVCWAYFCQCIMSISCTYRQR
jgi:hypothetical protein